MVRDLEWDGCRNVRDLGGLPLVGGGTTRAGRIVRSDNPARLRVGGWQALRDHGVRTVVLLRTIGADDPDPDPATVPPGIDVVRVALEDATDPTFRRRCIDTGWWATPLAWREMLERWPDRCAAAVGAVAGAGSGAVVVSCGIGRDRTGLVSFLLLALAGVTTGAIVDDWSRSLERLAGDPLADGLSPRPILTRAGRSVAEVVEDARAIGVAARLVEGSLRLADLDAVRGRLVDGTDR